MTIANSFASKLFVGFVAIAMMLWIAAPAKAATEAELQAQIDSLMATINALQAQLGQSDTTTATVCPYAWTRSLSQGDTGMDVMKLQQFLNADADTQVAAAGNAGSAGMETQYYGPATAAAVSNFQVKYRDEILTPVGLVNPTGYFGPSSMSKANALCVAAPSTGDNGDGDTSTDNGDSSSSADLNGGETNISSYSLRKEESKMSEGQSDVPVMRAEFDVKDGDAMLNRMDVIADGSNNGEYKPWNTFDELSVWVDGDKVASEDVSSKSDWSEYNQHTGTYGNDAYSVRLSGIDSIFREGDTAKVVVAFSVANSVDINSNDSWRFAIDDSGMRFTDGLGLTTKFGNATKYEDVDIQEAGANDDLNLQTSEDNPDAQTIQVSRTKDMEYPIMAFDLDAGDSDNNVTLNKVYVNVAVGGPGTSVDGVVNDFRLVVDGDSYDSESYTGSGSSTAGIEFNIDGDTSIDAGDSVTAVLYANFNDVSSSFNYATISASTTKSDIKAEGADDITVDGGTVKGEVQTARLKGVDVSLVSEDTSIRVNSTDTTNDDEGVFTVKFDVTAFGDDLYIPFGASTSTDTTMTKGLLFKILNNANGSVDLTGATTTIATDVSDSSAVKSNSYRVGDGQTKTFTMTVRYDPATSGAYKLRLDTVNYNTSDSATAATAQSVSSLNIDTAKLTI